MLKKIQVKLKLKIKVLLIIKQFKYKKDIYHQYNLLWDYLMELYILGNLMMINNYSIKNNLKNLLFKWLLLCSLIKNKRIVVLVFLGILHCLLVIFSLWEWKNSYRKKKINPKIKLSLIISKNDQQFFY